MKSIGICVLVCGLIAAGACTTPAVIADPYSSTDVQYLAALRHGSTCCPNQGDTPVWYSTPEEAIDVGKKAAAAMTSNPTYDEFTYFSNLIMNASRASGRHPMNYYEAGMVVLLGMRYYAAPSVECQFRSNLYDDNQAYLYGDISKKCRY
jgi:hypothetical protein